MKKRTLKLTLILLLNLFFIVQSFITHNYYFLAFWSICILSIIYGWTRKRKLDDTPSKTSEKWQKDKGIFSYESDGFLIQFDKKERQIKWKEIDTIFAYKKDYYSIDAIWLDVFYGNKSFSISEDVKGWPQFLTEMAKAFPQIEVGWDVKIAYPAFKTNMTLLYDRQIRVFEDAVKTCYKP